MGKNGNIHPSRIFKTPDELFDAFLRYKENLKEQSQEWKKVLYVGKDGSKVEDPQKVPMTMEGFERFCYENYGGVNHYFDNKEGYYDDFGTICLRIRSEIRENQIIGGLLNFYNPSITQRLTNLIDRKDIKSDDRPLQEAQVVLPNGMSLEDYIESKGI